VDVKTTEAAPARGLYTAEATVTGGRALGYGRTTLDVQLRRPKEMGRRRRLHQPRAALRCGLCRLLREHAERKRVATHEAQISTASIYAASVWLLRRKLVIRRRAADSRETRKSPILNMKMVGGTGHYLNRSNEFEMSLLGLLRGYAPAAQHGH